MFSAQTIMSADAWGALPARSSSFQDRNGKECSAYCLRINDGSTVWDYEGWLKNLDGNNAVFCEAGSCSIMLNVKTRPGWSCSPMAEDMYLKNTKRLKMSGHIFFNLDKYAGVHYLDAHPKYLDYLVSMPSLTVRSPYRHLDANKLFIHRADNRTWTVAACDTDIVAAMSRDNFRSRTKSLGLQPDEFRNFDYPTEQALPYHLHTYGGVEEAVIRDWDDKMKENAEAYRERSYQRTQARLAEMNAQMAANRAVWLHARAQRIEDA